MLECAATDTLSRTPLEARVIPCGDLVHVCAYRLLASLCACVLSCTAAESLSFADSEEKPGCCIEWTRLRSTAPRASGVAGMRCKAKEGWCILNVSLRMASIIIVPDALRDARVDVYCSSLLCQLQGACTSNATHSHAGIWSGILGQPSHAPQQPIGCAHSLAYKAWIRTLLWPAHCHRDVANGCTAFRAVKQTKAPTTHQTIAEWTVRTLLLVHPPFCPCFCRLGSP